MLNEEMIEFQMRHGTKAIVKVSSCPDLSFHRYAGYMPTNEQLCEIRDSIKTREGHSCRIQKITLEMPNDKEDATSKQGS